MIKTALVTGATGFIGHHICNRLFENNWNVIAVGVKGENKPLCHSLIHSNLDELQNIPNIDVCFHQAANNNTMDLNVENMFQSNLETPSILFDKLFNEKNCKQFVYASSCSVYGNQPVPYTEQTTPNPLNPYAKSKFAFETFANSFALKNNVNVIGLRYSNVYGPGENHKGTRSSMINQLLQKMLSHERPKIFKFGEHLRDWVYIEDVVEANILASEYKNSGVFNVGSGESTSFNDLIIKINQSLDMSLEPEYIDCSFTEAYQSNTLCDLEQANKYLGYFPKFNSTMGIKKFAQIKKATT